MAQSPASLFYLSLVHSLACLSLSLSASLSFFTFSLLSCPLNHSSFLTSLLAPSISLSLPPFQKVPRIKNRGACACVSFVLLTLYVKMTSTLPNKDNACDGTIAVMRLLTHSSSAKQALVHPVLSSVPGTRIWKHHRNTIAWRRTRGGKKEREGESERRAWLINMQTYASVAGVINSVGQDRAWTKRLTWLDRKKTYPLVRFAATGSCCRKV